MCIDVCPPHKRVTFSVCMVDSMMDPALPQTVALRARWQEDARQVASRHLNETAMDHAIDYRHGHALGVQPNMAEAKLVTDCVLYTCIVYGVVL